MSDNKKYYYLKLKDSFFDSEEIKLIESMENGYIYSNLYLKMILLSLKYEGRLVFKERIPYDEKMLSTITGMQLDNVRCGITVLIKYGLIEILDSGVIYMSDIQLLIGHGSTEAERKAKYRKRIDNEKKKIGHCPGQNPPELEIELNIEKEIDNNKPKKHKYGEYKNILLTDAEKERLESELGGSLFNKVITFYSAWKEEKQPKTKSDNLTIRRWVIDAVKEKQEKKVVINYDKYDTY